MAEIKIEKKPPIWPWILLGLIILAIALYFLVFKDQNTNQIINDEADTTAMVTDDQTDNDGAVANYLSFIKEEGDTMTVAHDYSHKALTKLANATEEMAKKAGVDVSVDLNEAKSLSQDITDNWSSSTHADDIKKASIIIANALGTIQKAKFPDLANDSEDLMENAKEIDENDLTLNQKSTVKSFYNDAADMLQSMNSKY